MKRCSFLVTLCCEDKKLIDDNINRLKLITNKKITRSELVVFLLKKMNSKQSLFDIGYISILEFHDTTKFKKNFPLLKKYK